jgi:hypothetical protein
MLETPAANGSGTRSNPAPSPRIFSEHRICFHSCCADVSVTTRLGTAGAPAVSVLSVWLAFTALFPMPEALAADTPAARPVVLRDTPVDTLATFFAAIDQTSGASDSMLRRMLGAPNISVETKEPVSRVRVLLASDVDPKFERWQRGADERLK